MSERLSDDARRIARLACTLVGAQRWVVYSIGADGNAGQMLWADEDEQRCAAYFAGHYRHDPLAPHRIACRRNGMVSLRQSLAAERRPAMEHALDGYERDFMRPYHLSDAIDMLLPVGAHGAGWGISLLRDDPQPAFGAAQMTVLADFHHLALRSLRGLPQHAAGQGGRERLAAHFPQLTSRELDIAMAVAAGMPNKLAARHTGMSPATVKTHLHHIYQKCGVANRSELVRLTACPSA